MESVSPAFGKVCATKIIDNTRIEYVLLTCIHDDRLFPTYYGISVSKWADTSETMPMEDTLIYDISANRDYVLDVIERIHLLSVTPVSLYDVIYDLVADMHAV